MSRSIISDEATATVEEAPAPTAVQTLQPEELVLEDLLIEEVSIDGMCGVY